MSAHRLLPSLLLFIPLLGGCQLSDLPSVDLERMTDQPHLLAYEATRHFPDGRVLQQPPEGTVPRERGDDPAVETGLVEGDYLTEFPIPMTLDLLKRGRGRYDVLCAPCHGIAGDADTIVADNMSLRRPPVLVGPVASALPDGRLYQVIAEGYGLMRSYSEDLPTSDRWAVVAYLRALQRSRGVAVGSLSPEVRRRLEQEAR